MNKPSLTIVTLHMSSHTMALGCARLCDTRSKMFLYLYLVRCELSGRRGGGTYWSLLVEPCMEVAEQSARDMFDWDDDPDLDVQCVGIADPQHAKGAVLLRVHESYW